MMFHLRKNVIQTSLALCTKAVAPVLHHELTLINVIFWKAEFNFISQTLTWLLPDVQNEEITDNNMYAKNKATNR